MRRLRLEALRTAPAAFGASHEEALQLTDDDFRQRVEAASPGAIFGAFEADALIGMAGVFLEAGLKSRQKAYVWGVFVDSAHRGQRVAAALVLTVIAHASGIAVVLNSAVVTSNTRAAGLYAGLDFKTYGIERKALCVDGVSYDEALIARDLGKAAKPAIQ